MCLNPPDVIEGTRSDVDEFTLLCTIVRIGLTIRTNGFLVGSIAEGASNVMQKEHFETRANISSEVLKLICVAFLNVKPCQNAFETLD